MLAARHAAVRAVIAVAAVRATADISAARQIVLDLESVAVVSVAWSMMSMRWLAQPNQQTCHTASCVQCKSVAALRAHARASTMTIRSVRSTVVDAACNKNESDVSLAI